MLFGDKGSKSFSYLSLIALSLLVCLAFIFITLPSSLDSLPKGIKVKRGKVSLKRQKDTLKIRASHNSIIEYQDFNIGRFEAIRFIQPSKKSRVLNRVVSGKSTQIHGNLFANGQVYLINPAGIYFGKQAHIDVAAFYAEIGRAHV